MDTINFSFEIRALLISETYPYLDGKGDYDMDLLKQCQQWFEQDEAQKVIDTLEAILPRSAPRNWTVSWPRHILPLHI